MKIVITEEQYNKLMEGYINFPIDEDIALEVWEDKDKTPKRKRKRYRDNEHGY